MPCPGTVDGVLTINVMPIIAGLLAAPGARTVSPPVYVPGERLGATLTLSVEGVVPLVGETNIKGFGLVEDDLVVAVNGIAGPLVETATCCGCVELPDPARYANEIDCVQLEEDTGQRLSVRGATVNALVNVDC